MALRVACSAFWCFPLYGLEKSCLQHSYTFAFRMRLSYDLLTIPMIAEVLEVWKESTESRRVITGGRKLWMQPTD